MIDTILSKVKAGLDGIKDHRMQSGNLVPSERPVEVGVSTAAGRALVQYGKDIQNPGGTQKKPL